MMTIQSLDGDKYRIRQTLERPVIYLDHWAVRNFSMDAALQDRLVSALHRVEGTWLFSSINLMELIAMNDINSAEAVEAMMIRVLPRLYVADFASDAGFLFEHGAQHDPRGAAQHWMLSDLGERARIAGGSLNVHRFVQDAIRYRDLLLPEFEDMRRTVTAGLREEVQQQSRREQARRFRPGPGMTLRYALSCELVRSSFLDLRREFDENDTMDLMHAAPSIASCDFVLLDGQWCHRANQAIRRLRDGGIAGRTASCFSPSQLPQFLQSLEQTR